jgi:hypothetical protein
MRGPLLAKTAEMGVHQGILGFCPWFHGGEAPKTTVGWEGLPGFKRHGIDRVPQQYPGP